MILSADETFWSASCCASDVVIATRDQPLALGRNGARKSCNQREPDYKDSI